MAGGGKGNLCAVFRYCVSGKGLLIDFLSQGHDFSWGTVSQLVDEKPCDAGHWPLFPRG